MNVRNPYKFIEKPPAEHQFNFPRSISSTSRGLIDHKTHMCRCNQKVIIRYNYMKPAGGYDGYEGVVKVAE